MASGTDVKISVIVPVYNVEKELPRCIESLLTQTYSNFELLLINDGSSDGSPEIMERYAEKDLRIRTLHKKMAGCPQHAIGGWNRQKANMCALWMRTMLWLRNIWNGCIWPSGRAERRLQSAGCAGE